MLINKNCKCCLVPLNTRHVYTIGRNEIGLWLNCRKCHSTVLLTPKPKTIALDYSLISDVEIDGIHSWGAPDFCDAYVSSASYNGRPMSDAELDVLNDDSDYVYAQVEKHLY